MPDLVIVGAGPAGLAAAHEAVRHGASALVLGRLDQVGGLARTLAHDGCLFDIGPHRFFTRNAEVHQLFVDVVSDDLVGVPRLTRILYGDALLNYPLTPVNATLNVGLAKAVAIAGSYARPGCHTGSAPTGTRGSRGSSSRPPSVTRSSAAAPRSRRSCRSSSFPPSAPGSSTTSS